MAGRPGTGGDPTGTAWPGCQDTGLRGWVSNGWMCSPRLSCKLHPRRVGQCSVYFRCTSWFYSNFHVSPYPDCAPNQSCADRWSWAYPSQAAAGPTKRRQEQRYSLPDNPPLPHTPVKVLAWQLVPAGKSQLVLFIYFSNKM